MDHYLKDIQGTVERMTSGRPAFVESDFLTVDQVLDELDQQIAGDMEYDDYLRRKEQAQHKRPRFGISRNGGLVFVHMGFMGFSF